MRPLVLKAAVMAVTFAGLACGPGGENPGATGSTFIALQKDFQGYDQWEPFPLADTSGTGDPHADGPRTVYLNKRPPTGSTTFPVGTILVKAPTGPEADTRQTFAMVKRGGTYNAKGATGWEWFELGRATDGSTAIVWRGLGPPAGEGYGTAAATCNECHAAAKDNDFVRAAELSLGEF